MNAFKKLLLLFLLSPAITFAEDFYLICEGEKEIMSKAVNDVSKQIVSVVVSEKSIKYDDEDISNFSSDRLKQNYDKTKEKIFFNSRLVDKEIISELRGEIDRISGSISVRERATGVFIYFSGKCKKTTERAF